MSCKVYTEYVTDSGSCWGKNVISFTLFRFIEKVPREFDARCFKEEDGADGLILHALFDSWWPSQFGGWRSLVVLAKLLSEVQFVPCLSSVGRGLSHSPCLLDDVIDAGGRKES